VGVKQSIGKGDGSIWRDHMRETTRFFEEPITLRRFISTSAGDDTLGRPAVPAFTDYPTRATIEDLAAQEIVSSNGIYATGDLKVHVRIPTFGADSGTGDFQSAPRQSDRVRYRNREYRFVGHIDTVDMAGRVYWKGVMRQVTSS